MIDLDRLAELDQFSALDLHFARFLQRLAGQESPELALAACLVSRAIGEGDVCINLHDLAQQPLGEEAAARWLRTPAAGPWLAALRASPVVGRPGAFQPLVLDAQGRLYLYRYWDYERRLAEDLLRRARNPLNVDLARLGTGLRRLFSAPAAGQDPDWQQIAAAVALLKRFCVISGGPGTGKTSTVIRILALLVEQAGGRVPGIALAAPTGKAAARMQEAVRAGKQALDLDPALLAAIPEEASTIHRLLGVIPDSVYFRHHRDNPLPLDVLVVDEASMIDLALMAKLVEALPERARLILLGDRDQLASVEAGSVLGDICAGGGGFSKALRSRLEALGGVRLPASEGTESPLRDTIVLLRKSYRFDAAGGIGKLARAVNRGRGGEALSLLQSGAFADAVLRTPALAGEFDERLAQLVDEGYGPYLQALAAKAETPEVFAAFNRFRVLCALRNGPFGVEALNERIEDLLRARRLIPARQTWYHGRPVMITRNDYNLRLFNGDVGIVLADAGAAGRLRVVFQASDGSLRRLAPMRLPVHETVFAMTVHKSQGSEFAKVLMILPLEGVHRLSRELVYTGVTRAQQAVEIWAEPQSFEAMVVRELRRSSGLRDALWGV